MQFNCAILLHKNKHNYTWKEDSRKHYCFRADFWVPIMMRSFNVFGSHFFSVSIKYLEQAAMMKKSAINGDDDVGITKLKNADRNTKRRRYSNRGRNCNLTLIDPRKSDASPARAEPSEIL